MAKIKAIYDTKRPLNCSMKVNCQTYGTPVVWKNCCGAPVFGAMN